jgi:hypothetical protein
LVEKAQCPRERPALGCEFNLEVLEALYRLPGPFTRKVTPESVFGSHPRQFPDEPVVVEMEFLSELFPCDEHLVVTVDQDSIAVEECGARLDLHPLDSRRGPAMAPLPS